MLRPHRNTVLPLTDALRGLATGVTVFDLDEAWLAVGPSGIFVLTEDTGDLDQASARAAERASKVRRDLADKMAWVPFVDAVCTTTKSTFDPNQPCLVVPLDLVVSTVSEGPQSIDADSVELLRALPYPILR